MSSHKLTGDALEIYRGTKAAQLRAQGMCIADIAEELFGKDKGGINRVHKLLMSAPRRIRFRGGELVERDASFAHAKISRSERP